MRSVACELEYAGFVLGGTADDNSRLRLLNSSGLDGFGVPPVVQPETPAMQGGTFLGRGVVSSRTIQAGTLQASDWGVAREFVSAMWPTPELQPLVYRGPAYSKDVRLYVAPQGAALKIDAGGQSLDTIHIGDTTWIAPDPTIYSDDTTVETGTVTSSAPSTVEWTNPGFGVPPYGLGGHAWTFEGTVTSGFVLQITITQSEYLDNQWVAAAPIRFEGLFNTGNTVTVDSDRIVTFGSDGTPAAARTYLNGRWVPQMFWPRFRGGVPSRLQVEVAGTGAMEMDYDVTFRGTWT